MVVGDGEAKEIVETHIAETGVLEQDGIGWGRMAIDIRFLIARVTLAPLKVLMEPRTLLHGLDLTQLPLKRRMP